MGWFVVGVGAVSGLMLGVALQLPQKYAIPITVGLALSPALLLITTPRRLLGLYLLVVPLSPGLMLLERLETTSTQVNLLIKIYLSDFVLVALAVAVAWKVWSQGKRRSIWTAPTTFPLLLWIGAGLLSVVPAVDKVAVVGDAIHMTRIALLYWSVFHICRFAAVDRTLTACLFALLAIQVGIMVSQFATGSVVVDVPGLDARLTEEDALEAGVRPPGTLGHSSHYARLAGLILPLSLARMLFGPLRRERVIGLLVQIIGVVGLAMAVSRIGIIAIVISETAFLLGCVACGLMSLARAVRVMAVCLVAGVGLIWMIAAAQWQARLTDDGGAASVRLPM
jgi:hypothetical protein